MAYRIQLQPVSNGTSGGSNTLKKGIAKSEGVPHDMIIEATSAQIQGIMGYVALIKNGDDTSTVETAITALTP